MKRFSTRRGEFIENAKVDAFLNDIIAVCKAHGLSLAHEDRHGGFEVEPFSDELVLWLLDATDASEGQQDPPRGAIDLTR